MAAFHPKRMLMPSNAIRIVELLCAVLALATVAGWNSNGITYRDLNDHDYNMINNINFFIAIAVICILFLSANVLLVMFNRPQIPPQIDLPLCGFLGLLALLASVILAASLGQLGESISVKEAGLSFFSMECSLVFGLVCSICLFCSTWFAFQTRTMEREIPAEQTRSIAELPGDIPT